MKKAPFPPPGNVSFLILGKSSGLEIHFTWFTFPIKISGL